MNEYKNDLTAMSTRRLLTRRRAVAAGVGDVERVLAGSLVAQTRRCGKRDCRCVDGQPHGPYSYFSPRSHGRGRLKYVPAGLTDVVGRYLHRHGEVDAALAEISAINAELLARRELS